MTSFSDNRMPRLSFFLWHLIFFAVAFTIDVLFYIMKMPELVNIVQVIFAIAGIALTVKRLHDLDKSGWWILAPYGLLIFGIIILIAGGDHVVTAAISLLIMIPALLFQPALFFWPGTRGPNRFGPDQRLYRQTNMLPAE